MSRGNADLHEATEQGATAVAIIIIEDASEHVVLERAAKTTGVDYWLGDKGSEKLTLTARLEVPGTLSGERERIRRVARKLKQTEQSDRMKIPALAVVVDFAEFVAEVAKRA